MKVYNLSGPTPQGKAAYDHQAFLIAIDFHEAAVRAGETERDPSGAPVLPLSPMIVCYAFAAELYLKSLFPAPRRGHNLSTLFGHLDAFHKNEVTLRYQLRTGRQRRALEHDLKLFAEVFHGWRYVFEGQGQQVHVNLLMAFVKALYETVRDLRPAWTISDFRHERLRADMAKPIMTAVNFGGGVFVEVVDGTGGKLNTPEA